MTLVFGCRRPEEDHLYWEEMLEMARKGVLHEVHTAYSRLPDQPKVNATTARVERAEHLKNRLCFNYFHFHKSNAIFYLVFFKV